MFFGAKYVDSIWYFLDIYRLPTLAFYWFFLSIVRIRSDNLQFNFFPESTPHELCDRR